MQGPRALNEALGLDRAVAAALELVDLQETLVLGSVLFRVALYTALLTCTSHKYINMEIYSLTRSNEPC
jgi:hypothetical protein